MRGELVDRRAEGLALGAMMIDSRACYYGLCTLTDDHFTTELHRLVCQVLRELYDIGEATEVWRVDFELLHRQEVDYVGLDWLEQLVSQVPAPSMIESYCSHLDRLYQMRRVQSSLATAQQQLTQGDGEGAAQTLQKGAREYAISRPKASPRQQVRELRAQLELEIQGKGMGLDTPFRRLTQMLGGWQTGCSYVLAGLTSVGKTHIMLQMVLAVAVELAQERQGRRVMIWEKEMKAQLVRRKLAGLIANMSLSHTRMHGMNPDRRERMNQALLVLESLPIDVDDTRSHLYEMTRTAARNRGRHALYVLDHMQITKVPRITDEFPRLSAVSGEMKQLALDTDVPVLCLSQFNRSGATTDDEPRIWHLRGSSAIEDDCDGIMILHRKNYGKPDVADLSAKLRLEKNRPTGEVGIVKLTWNAMTDRYEEDAQ